VRQKGEKEASKHCSISPLLCASSCEAELTATLHSEQYSSLFAFSSSVSTEGHVVLLVAVVGSFSTLEVISVVMTLLFRISTVVVVDIAGVSVVASVGKERRWKQKNKQIGCDLWHLPVLHPNAVTTQRAGSCGQWFDYW